MIISIASGKGGTGKTLVATSLALSLQGKGKVTLLDCDVEEPNDHIFINPRFQCNEPVSLQIPQIDKTKCTLCDKCSSLCAYHAIAKFPKQIMVFPQLCHSCGACGYLCPEKAITEIAREIGIVEYGRAGTIDFVRGELRTGEAMAVPVIKKVKENINSAGIVIIDAPPGTSCPVVESIKDSDFCLLVTEPTPFGLNDLMLAVETANVLNIPVGVIINRAGSDNGRIEAYCVKEDIPILMQIPFDMEIARNYSRGFTLVTGMPDWKIQFQRLISSILEITNERSHSIKR
jgi:MinD superfamily P-loop ATPase